VNRWDFRHLRNTTHTLLARSGSGFGSPPGRLRTHAHFSAVWIMGRAWGMVQPWTRGVQSRGTPFCAILLWLLLLMLWAAPTRAEGRGDLEGVHAAPLPPGVGPPDLHMVHDWEVEYAPWRPLPGSANATTSLQQWRSSTPRPRRRGMPRDAWQALPVDDRVPRFKQCMAQQARELSERVPGYACSCVWVCLSASWSPLGPHNPCIGHMGVALCMHATPTLLASLKALTPQ
jgi:hypothetical protein